MSVWKQFCIVAALGLLLAGGWYGLAGRDEDAGDGPPRARAEAGTRVLVEPLALADDKVTVRAIGTGEALTSASLHPETAGEVVEILFAAGQHVAKGDALLRLDDKHQQLAVRLAEVALAEARREHGRLRKLAPKGAVTEVRLDAAETAESSAGLRLAQARAELADRLVTAPFDGVVGLTAVDVGDRIDEDTAIATLDDRSAILVDFNLPEEHAARIRLGDPLKVRAWSLPEAEFTGTVFATASRIDATSRTLKVRARVPNGDDTLRPGSSFEVALEFPGRAYPTVREVAVMWSRDGAYLWRATEGRAEKVFVKLVRRDRGTLLVDGPLRAGDMIVVEGVQGLRPGQPLAPEPFDPGTAAVAAKPSERAG